MGLARNISLFEGGTAGVSLLDSGEEPEKRCSISYAIYPQSLGPRIVAHEVGHALGREHAPCNVSGDRDFPYEDGSIGVWGYDSRDGHRFLGPTSHADLMGYCDDNWISDYTYDAMLRRTLHVNVDAGLVHGSPLVSGTPKKFHTDIRRDMAVFFVPGSSSHRGEYRGLRPTTTAHKEQGFAACVGANQKILATQEAFRQPMLALQIDGPGQKAGTCAASAGFWYVDPQWPGGCVDFYFAKSAIAPHMILP